MNNVEKLILGRREIDRKKAEIKEVVTTLLRHIPIGQQLELSECSSTVEIGGWILWLKGGENGEIWLNYDRTGIRCLYSCDSHGKVTCGPNVEDVEELHRSLEELMEQMFQKFKGMEIAFRPYFRAAEAAA